MFVGYSMNHFFGQTFLGVKGLIYFFRSVWSLESARSAAGRDPQQDNPDLWGRVCGQRRGSHHQERDHFPGAFACRDFRLQAALGQ